MKVLIGVDPHKGVGRRRGGRRSHRRAPRACQLPAGPRRLEIPRTLGETVPRASLGGGERRRPRSAPGGEVGGGRRVGGGRAAQAFGAGAGCSRRGNARKNDGVDALATALAASRNERLAAVDPEADSEVLRLLSERREDLVAERTRALNRLHGLLRDLLPGGVAGTLSAHRAARILRGIRPQGSASARLRRRLASEVLRDVRTLDRKIADLNERIEAEVEASGTTLTEIFGIGPILAARIIGTVGNVARFPTKAHFASYSGTAPVEASSGEVVRHRLSLAGNRKLNYALHMVAVCQARSDARGGSLLPQEDRGGQIPQGGAAVPQEAHLRCRLQEPHGGFAGAFAQRRLTKRSRELRYHEVSVCPIAPVRSAPAGMVRPRAALR